jgi:hypothetical protein
MKNDIFRQIIKYIDEHDILNDYDTYEQMPVFHVLKELDCLVGYIKEEFYTSFCVNMAIMYVNQSLLYAKSKLSENDLKNFIIYFDICVNKDDEGDYITVDVVFSRKANEHISMFKMPIDIKDTKVYEHIKNTIGINDFTCYYYKNEYEDEYFSFVPKDELREKVTG